MHIYQPSAPLRPFIKHFIVIESESAIVNRILPGTSLVLAFRFKGQINYVTTGEKIGLPSFVLTGINKSVRLINYEAHSGTIVVVFKEAGATLFFKEPLHTLSGLSVPLDQIIHPGTLALIEEQLLEANIHTERIVVLEQFLLGILHDRKPDQLILEAVRQIQASQGKIRIKAIADSLFISQDAFEKRFRKTIGTAPKQFSSIIRMKWIIGQALCFPQTLTDLAFEADFFDQPHFNKNFKVFTGQTPADFFKSPVFW